MTEKSIGTKGEQESDWTVEVLKVGADEEPFKYLFSLTYRSNGETLQLQEKLRLDFPRGGGPSETEPERIKDFIETHQDWQLVRVPDYWVPGAGEHDDGYGVPEEHVFVGWREITSDEEIASYHGYKAEHALHPPDEA